MKRIVLSILLLPNLFLFGQENRSEYEKAVDYVTCVCINDTHGITNKNCEEGDAFTESELEDYPATQHLFKAFQRVKGDSIPDNIVDFLSDSIFDNNGYSEIKTFADKRQGDRLNSIKSQIRSHLGPPNPDGDTTINENTDPMSSISFEGQRAEKSRGSFFTVNFWAILAGVLLIVVFVVLSKRITNVNRKVKKIEEKQSSPLISRQPKSQDVSVYPQVEQLLKKIEKRIDNLESINSAKDSKVIEENLGHVREWDEPKYQRDEQVVYYMATPDRDGFFNTSSQHNSHKQGSTFYRLHLDSKDKNNATFDFYSDEYGIRMCASYPQTYLDPVCEPINAENPNAQKIITVEPGKAEKKDEKWVVTKKAKIRYE